MTESTITKAYTYTYSEYRRKHIKFAKNGTCLPFVEQAASKWLSLALLSFLEKPPKPPHRFVIQQPHDIPILDLMSTEI